MVQVWYAVYVKRVPKRGIVNQELQLRAADPSLATSQTQDWGEH